AEREKVLSMSSHGCREGAPPERCVGRAYAPGSLNPARIWTVLAEFGPALWSADRGRLDRDGSVGRNEEADSEEEEEGERAGLAHGLGCTAGHATGGAPEH